MRHGWRETGPVTASSLTVCMLVDEARSLVRLAVSVGRRFRLRCRVIAPSESAVVEALCKEYQIGDGIIDGEDDLATPVSTSPAGKVREAWSAFSEGWVQDAPLLAVHPAELHREC